MKENKTSTNPIDYMRKLLQTRKELERESYTDSSKAEHRLESMGEIEGIEFINDSMSTDIDSTWYALEKMTKQIVWIVGGVDKGNDYSVVGEIMREKVKAIICLGKDNGTMIKIFQYQNVVPMIIDAQEMFEAVQYAAQYAKKGDVVLFSPACPSYDLFENYEIRGNSFKNSVKTFYNNSTK